jgi:hypothetical protein
MSGDVKPASRLYWRFLKRPKGALWQSRAPEGTRLRCAGPTGGLPLPCTPNAAAPEAGLRRPREEGTKLGRKRLEDTDAANVAAIRAMRISRIARELGVGVGTVLRVTG